MLLIAKELIPHFYFIKLREILWFNWLLIKFCGRQAFNAVSFISNRIAVLC